MTRAVKILWRATLLAIGLFILLIFSIDMGWLGHMPSIADLQNPTAYLASEVYADDGTQMGKYYLEDRSPVELKDISKNVTNALIATEDERFYDHSGIDGKSIARAVKGVLVLNPDGGGSTITQQLALNLFGGKRASNKPARILQKLKEWVIAVKLERNFTKDEIINNYLNTVPFGDNVYGIRNASRTFFQKEPDRVSVSEAAVLVGMLKGNTQYNPRRNPKAALDRRNTVMDQLVRNNFLSSAEAETLEREPIQLNYKKMDQSAGIAPYFRENVLKDEVKKLLKDKKKPNGDDYNIYHDGLKIYTTINPTMQRYGEEALAKNAQKIQQDLFSVGSIRSGSIWAKQQKLLERHIKETDRWHNQNEDGMSDADNRASFNIKQKMKVFAWNTNREKDTMMTPADSVRYHRSFAQSGMMAMEPQSGYVKAWIGGIDYKHFKYDHVNVNAKRQVGSSIKPMLYCEAIEEAGFTPETQCPNVPQMFPGGMLPATGAGARGGTYPLYYAIALSLNGVAAYLMKTVGPQRFVDFLTNCNVQTKLHAYPANALGACDLSLYEMMWMYTMFPGRGFNTKPQFITRIEDHNGNVLVQVAPQHKEVISEVTAYTMEKMMTGCVQFGTGKRFGAYNIKADVGAKTGTTNDNVDCWFMSYTPELIIGDWVGADDNFLKMQGDGARIAMPGVGFFMKSILEDKKLGYDPEAKFIKPPIEKNDIISDYIQGYMGPPPPDAEGQDVGNGNASAYDAGGYDTTSTSGYGDERPTNPKPDTSKNKSPKALMPPKPKVEPEKKDNGY